MIDLIPYILGVFALTAYGVCFAISEIDITKIQKESYEDSKRIHNELFKNNN